MNDGTMGGRVAFATKHDKGPLVAGPLEAVGLEVVVVPVDTDRFGTFTRSTPRVGDQREAARKKCEAAFDADPDADWALSSEGAFGPCPNVGWLVRGRELLMLRSRRGVEIVALDLTYETAFRHARLRTLDEVHELATKVGFPEQALFVATPPTAGDVLADAVSVDDEDALVAEATLRLRRVGEVWLEADVRAHRSPLRRASIRRAAERLARLHATPCPRCAHPGFGASRVEGRAPCEACGTPGDLPAFEVAVCPACSFERASRLHLTTPLDRCPRCNP